MVSQISFNRCLINACFGVGLLLTACLPSPLTPPSIVPTCISSLDANPYTSPEITQRVKDIYQKSFTDLGSARQDALFQLGQSMEHWSAQVDLVNDDFHMVRITVTYLDPILIQYIKLNEVLSDPNFLANTSNSPLSASSFEFNIKNTLAHWSLRNEMLFMVTITSPFYQSQAFNSTDLTVKLPINKMLLSSASYTEVEPTHFDRILDENMNITHGPVSGIVGYPLELQINQDQCNMIIDQYTTTVILDIPEIKLGDISYAERFWNIRSQSMAPQGAPTHDPFFLNNPINKLEQPPTPSWTPVPGSATTNQKYWEDMGRYVWKLVITQSP